MATVEESINMSSVIKCSFCNEEGHSLHNEEGETTCPTLLTHLCTYCKKTGHTNKRCPTAKANHLKRQAELQCTYCKKPGHRNRDCPAGKQALKEKKERDERQKEHKITQIANRTYAGLVMSSITSEEEQKIDKEEQEMHKMLRERREAQQKAKREQWEANYPGRMEAYHGSFWMFFVYGTKYDYENITKPLRNAKAQADFLKYLEEKYPGDWKSSVVNTRDFCPFVEKLIHTILEESVRNTMDATEAIMKEKKELEGTLTPEELEAHLSATTDEFMAELEPTANTEWKKAGKKKGKNKAVTSDI